MPQKPILVFLDANVIIQVGKPPGGPLFSRAVDLVKGGFITVLTTDLTIAEVAKKHVENDYNLIKDIGKSHFRRVVEETVGVKLPEVEYAQIKSQLSEKYTTETGEMFSALGAKVLSIDSIPPSTVFSAYASGEGLFSEKGKRHQFPDAFIFECLKTEATIQSPVVVVSKDGDYAEPVENEEHITLVTTIPDLFKILELDVKAPDIEEFLEAQNDQLLKVVGFELGNWGLEASDIPDAYVEETVVTEVELIDLTSFGKTSDDSDILVVGTMKITADASYSHPNWDTAMYDSEDKVLIPFEDVSGEAEIVLTVDFSMSIFMDDDGIPAEIEEFRFRNDNFIYVDLNPIEAW